MKVREMHVRSVPCAC